MNPSTILRLRREAIKTAVSNVPSDPIQLTGVELSRMMEYVAGSAFDTAIEAIYPDKEGRNPVSEKSNGDESSGSQVAKIFASRVSNGVPTTLE